MINCYQTNIYCSFAETWQGSKAQATLADVYFLCPHVTNYNFMSLVYSPSGVKSRHDLDLQLWLISRASCCNTFEISIF